MQREPSRYLHGELNRLIRLGASALPQEPVGEAGWRWHILADPAGTGTATITFSCCGICGHFRPPCFSPI